MFSTCYWTGSISYKFYYSLGKDVDNGFFYEYGEIYFDSDFFDIWNGFNLFVIIITKSYIFIFRKLLLFQKKLFGLKKYTNKNKAFISQ